MYILCVVWLLMEIEIEFYIAKCDINWIFTVDKILTKEAQVPSIPAIHIYVSASLII